MLSKVESENNSNGGSNSGQLLRDIEAISKALYLHKGPPKDLISPSQNRSKSTGKTRLESKSHLEADIVNRDLLRKDKKSSIWNWKKPLRALSHIRDRKFSCCFYLHVHSIEGLPANFNDLGCRVHWKRKDEVLQTQPIRVDQGIAEFEETLMHRCSVYGHRSGTQQSAKYEVKLFMVYASIVGASGLDIGKHWVDLTRLLPLTLEELEEDGSSGKWTTSFKLTGKAKGATLNVSFGYSVMGNNSVLADGNLGAPLLSNLDLDRSSTVEKVGISGHGMFQRVGSVLRMTNHGSHLPSQSMDVKILHESFPNQGLTLSRSINLLYNKLDEAKWGNSVEFSSLDKELQVPQLKLDVFSEFTEKPFGDECDDIEFTVIEQGIELSRGEQLKLDEGADQTFDCSVANTIRAAETMRDDVENPDEVTKHNSNDDAANGCKLEENNVCTGKSAMEELELTFDTLLHPESVGLNSQLNLCEILSSEYHMEEKYLSRRESFTEDKSDYKAPKITKSLSLDDVTESVARDFFNLLGVEHSPCGSSSDSNPESPRECLWRQFEKDALASGDFIFNNDDKEEEEVEFDYAAPSTSGVGDFPENLEFSLIIQDAEQEYKKGIPSLMSRRKAKLLEKLETEALMQDWGLNEMAFQSSPRCSSGGFGSPIYIPPEEPVKLPPLGEGLGPLLQMKKGGVLRSMNPFLFRNAKNGGNLIMQVSRPVVLPAELGSEIMEILQHLGSIGAGKLSMQVHHLMPLEDITGKTMQQVAWEAGSFLEMPEIERMDFLQPKSMVKQHSFGAEKEVKVWPSTQNYKNLYSSSIGGDKDTDYMSLGDIAPLAMDTIEALSIDGLRIQSGMFGEEAPSSIHPHALNATNFCISLRPEGANGLQKLDFGVDVNGLLGLSVTLDEWLRLDAGNFCDEDYICQHTLKILAAHHAKCTDFFGQRLIEEGKWGRASRGGRCGLLGNNLIVAFMVQLRDPLRNYEPVGAPLLALIQVERVNAPMKRGVLWLRTEKINVENDVMVVQEDSDEERREKKKDDDIDEDIEAAEVGGGEDEDEEDEEEEGTLFKISKVHVAGLITETKNKKLWGTTSQQQSGYRWLLASGMGRTNKHPLSKSKAIIKASPLAMAKMHPRDTLWSISSCVSDAEGQWKELAALNVHTRNPDVVFLDETIR